MSEIEETAKAVQEASKLGRDLVKSIKHVERIGRQLLGPFGEGYGILTDLVRHKRDELNWRFRNRKTIYELAQKKMQQKGLSVDELTTVPKRIAYEYEDGLEREDDETLQELWANLLVNVTNPKGETPPAKIYKDVLCRLDKEEALLLNELGLRADEVSFYFVVCDVVDAKEEVVGSQLACVRPAIGSKKALSTELFPYSAEEDCFYPPWSADRLTAMVDILHSMGLLYWTNELHFAQEMFDTDQRIAPTNNPIEIGRRVLDNAKGVRAFSLSQLGQDFVKACCS